MLKRFICVIVIMVMAFSVCGCSSGSLNAKSVDEVKDYLVQKDYYDEENCKSYSQGEYSSLGGLMNNNWTAFFFDFGEDDSAADEYIDLTLSGIEITDNRKRSNCTIYERDGSPNYCLFVRIDNTFLEVFGPQAEKNEIIAFANDIGYYYST